MKLNLKTAATLSAVFVMTAFTSYGQSQNKVEQTGTQSEDITEIKNSITYSRALEAAIWGMPLMNFDAMRQGYENNRVTTVAGQDFFLMYRIYGAKPEVLKDTSPWTLNDVVKVK